LERLKGIEGIKIFGEYAEKIPTYSFLLKNIHPLDAGMVFDKLGIAVRTGTHCAQPLMRAFGIDGTIRASFTFYNTKEECDLLIDAIERVKIMFE
jgi:cysteine desulfurase/selenocysteine lyase